MENSKLAPDNIHNTYHENRKKFPEKIGEFFSWVGFHLKMRRWLIMPLFGMAIVIIEALEHISVGESIFTTHFLSEIVIYGISLSIVGTLLLNWVDKAELDRQIALSELNQIHAFSNQLRNASTWDDLTISITEFLNSVIPVTSCSLFINNSEDDRMEFVSTWKADGNHQVDPDLVMKLERCKSCQHWSIPMTGVHKCSTFLDSQFLQSSELHCLPLVFKSYLSGILIFTVTEGQKISSQQIKTLGEFGPKIALALENNYLLNKVQIQTNASIIERNRIAQDLHDTLGQNLSYLRLKLDQMSEHHSLLSIGELESSLAGMRDIANEAYLQMRATLANLHSSANVELTQSLRTHAEKTAARANFQVEIINQGEAVPLAPHVKRQVLYICREALNNVEKHANAHLVKINLDWAEENLSITINDDGCGIQSFDLCGDNHLGMTIMSERASDINAQLSFDSQEGQGMSVSLIVPLNTSFISQ